MQVFSASFGLSLAAACCLGSLHTAAAGAQAAQTSASRSVRVVGSGMDMLNGAIVHSKKTTPTGEVRRSTEIVELRGDLNGKILYQVTTVINTTLGTLLNTGDQVFSGTIMQSDPVMIHDSRFRFDVNLATGAESGSVYLLNPIAGPTIRCELKVSGTGMNADGNPTFDYTGICTFGAPN